VGFIEKVYAGIPDPLNTDFVLEGVGFRGMVSRAFVQNILVFLPGPL
jgi:hypothetical protein